MKNKVALLIFGLLIVGVSGILGQGPSPADSLNSEQVARLRTVAEWKSKWDVARDVAVYFLPILSFLLGSVFTYLSVKNRIQKWAEEEITKKANEKIGVDWAVVKVLVSEKKALLDKRAKFKIAVINKNTGKRKELADRIIGAGYPEPIFFTFEDTQDPSKKVFSKDFVQNDFNLILIDDDEKEGIPEENILSEIILKHENAFMKNFIWFTQKRIKSFEIYKNRVAFVQLDQYLIENMDNRL